jgi:hypothetical protein
MVQSPMEQKISPDHKWFIPFEFSLDVLGQNPRLQFETALIRCPVFKEWMLDLSLLAFFVLQ